MKMSPFDHRQDRELGNALRSALSGNDEAGFVQRVVDAAAEIQERRAEAGDWWEILNSWSKPGLAAAAIGIVAAALFWWAGTQEVPTSSNALADPLQASVEIPAAFLANQAPDLNEVLALEFGN
jgi:hypothetical protein